MPPYYRLAPAVVLRLTGLAIVVMAVVEIVASTVAAAAQASIDIELVLLGAGVLIIVALALWWWRGTYVVRCDATGYTVRNVRGAGVKRAAWGEVEDAATTHVHDVPALVLTLKDDLRVGLVHVDSVEGNIVHSKTALRIFPIYRGTTLCNRADQPLGTVLEAKDSGELTLTAPPTGKISPGDDLWMIDTAVGETVRLPAILSWQK